MPDNEIIVRPGAVDLRIIGYRLQDFPNTGTYISTEKLSGRMVHQEGQKGTSASVRMSGKSYRVSTTVMQGSPTDRRLQNILIFFSDSDFTGSMTLNFLGMKYASTSLGGETEPTRELASDSSPNVVYTWVGSFPTVLPGIFRAPPVATEADLNNFLAGV